MSTQIAERLVTRESLESFQSLRMAVLSPREGDEFDFGNAFFRYLRDNGGNVVDETLLDERSTKELLPYLDQRLRAETKNMLLETDVVHVIWSAQTAKHMTASFSDMLLGIQDALAVRPKGVLTVIFLNVDEANLPQGFEDARQIHLQTGTEPDRLDRLKSTWQEASIHSSRG